MALLLPPQVVGPVYVNDFAVTVTGALSGAKVELFQDGQPLGAEPAGPGGSASISVPAGTLTPNAKLTATQSDGQNTSEPSRFPEFVLPLPPKAPPLAILSQVHPCMDAVLVGGVVNGALVELFHGPKLLGIQSGYGPEVYIPRQAADPLVDGDVVTVRQTYVANGQTLVSPPVDSVPLQTLALPPADDDHFRLPPLTIDGPLYACRTAVTVRGVLPGATVELFNGTQTETYWYVGQAINIGVPALQDGMKLNAAQRFNACGMFSRPSADAPVSKAAVLPKPVIHQPVCPGAPRITLSNLEPGAKVVIKVRQTVGPGSTAFHYWEATAGATTQSFDLPSDLQMEWTAPPEEISAYLMNCQDIPGYDADWVAFEQPGPASVDLVGPLSECQRRVRVEVGQPGVAVRLDSDLSPQMAAPVISYGPFVEVTLYRGLFDGETLRAVASACGGGPDVDDKERAEPLGQLDAPTVSDPVREWMTSVHVRHCRPGARVHVYVNEQWRGSADAATGDVWVDVGPLRADRDTVRARQALCTLLSDFGNHVRVTLGQLKASHKPSPIMHGPQPQPVIIEAVDADFGHVVGATVRDVAANAVLGPTGKAYQAAFPYFKPGPAWRVEAKGYAPRDVPWTLAYHKPVAAFTANPVKGPYPLTVQFADQSQGAITSWKWEFDYKGQTSNVKSTSFTYPEQRYGYYKPKLTVTGPGGSDTTQGQIEVHFQPQNAPPQTGYSAVSVMNQNLNYFPNFDPNEHKSLTVYSRNLTAQSAWKNEGDIDVGDSLDVDLSQKGHQYAIACVDTDMTGCNANDPNSVACVRQGFWATCDPDGPVAYVTVY